MKWVCLGWVERWRLDGCWLWMWWDCRYYLLESMDQSFIEEECQGMIGGESSWVVWRGCSAIWWGGDLSLSAQVITSWNCSCKICKDLAAIVWYYAFTGLVRLRICARSSYVFSVWLSSATLLLVLLCLFLWPWFRDWDNWSFLAHLYQICDQEKIAINPPVRFQFKSSLIFLKISRTYTCAADFKSQ